MEDKEAVVKRLEELSKCYLNMLDKHHLYQEAQQHYKQAEEAFDIWRSKRSENNVAIICKRLRKILDKDEEDN